MTIRCTSCDEPAAVSVRTGGIDSVRGLWTTIYYEPENAPKGAQAQCQACATNLLAGLMRVLA